MNGIGLEFLGSYFLLFLMITFFVLFMSNMVNSSWKLKHFVAHAHVLIRNVKIIHQFAKKPLHLH